MNEQKYFHDQHENEIFYGFFRKHWTKLFPTILRFFISSVLIAIALIFELYFLKIHEISNQLFDTIIIGTFLITIFEVNRFFLKISSWFLTVVILTDFRFMEVFKTLFLHDEKESVDLTKVQDIQTRKVGFLRNILGFGRIYLTLASIKDSREIRRVPNVSDWVEKCNKIRRDAFVDRIKKTAISRKEADKAIEQIKDVNEKDMLRSLSK